MTARQPGPPARLAWLARRLDRRRRDHRRREGGDAETLMRAVIDVALDAVVISARDGRVTLFNPAAERLFGQPASAAVGRRMSDFITAPQAGAGAGQAVAGASGAGLAGHGGNILDMLDRRMTLEGVRANGSRFPAEIAINRVETGDRVLYAAHIRDLSGEREAARALERQRQRLIEIERFSAMGSLLGSVAHEINNPLAILVAQATLLRDKAPTEDVRRRAERIHDAAQRAGRVVKNFTAMARQKAPVRDALDLNAVVDTTVALVVPGLGSAGIVLDRHLDPNLPDVKADRDLLAQVFATLVMNARRALAEAPEPRILGLTSRAEAGTAVVDIDCRGPLASGRGFAPEVAAGALGAEAGIGLPTCRALIEAHSGTLGLLGLPDGGLRFRVVLPAERGTAPPVAAARPEGLSILVVDDERDVAEALAELIDLFGHRVAIETSPLKALARLGAERFDAVFVDFRMPDLDGLAFRRRAGETAPTLAERIVIVTGDTLVASRDAELDGTGGPVLEKPFTAADVRGVIERLGGPVGTPT